MQREYRKYRKPRFLSTTLAHSCHFSPGSPLSVLTTDKQLVLDSAQVLKSYRFVATKLVQVEIGKNQYMIELSRLVN